MMRTLAGAMTLFGFATVLSCDSGSTQPADAGIQTNEDCPIGTFKPLGYPDCVVPADDQFGGSIGVTDNRCPAGQPAFPPTCVSTEGARPYFATSKKCAAGYRYEPGACQRGDVAGFGGNFGTGFGTGTAGTSGTGFGGNFGAAGVTGLAGSDGAFTGGGGDGGGFGTGAGGVTGAAGESDSGDGAAGSRPLPDASDATDALTSD